MNDEKHTTPQWWEMLIACPQCGASFTNRLSERLSLNCCSSCGLNYLWHNNVLVWASADAPKQKMQWKYILNKVRNQLNPLGNRLSPLRLLNDLRTDAYYQRTLTDNLIAKRWGNHYFKDLSLTKSDLILDHGCGRGRHIALLNLLGYKVVGQDISLNKWWYKMPASGFQVASPIYTKLPWASESFLVLINVGVISYLTDAQFNAHIKEVFRVLKPGGYWLILEANVKGYGASLSKRLIGQLYPLDYVKQLTRDCGFEEVDHSFEGFNAPVAPRFVNYLRKHCLTMRFDLSDFDSWIESVTPEERRAYWLLRLQKTMRLY